MNPELAAAVHAARAARSDAACAHLSVSGLGTRMGASSAGVLRELADAVEAGWVEVSEVQIDVPRPVER
jgi:hypothetical protein